MVMHSADSVDSTECDESLKHELGSIQRFSLSPVSSWCCDIIFVSYARGCGF